MAPVVEDEVVRFGVGGEANGARRSNSVGRVILGGRGADALASVAIVFPGGRDADRVGASNPRAQAVEVADDGTVDVDAAFAREFAGDESVDDQRAVVVDIDDVAREEAGARELVPLNSQVNLRMPKLLPKMTRNPKKERRVRRKNSPRLSKAW